MTPSDVLARALAAALLDGPWRLAAMIDRLREAVGGDRPWQPRLATAVLAAHADAPIGRLDDFVAWLATRRASIDAVKGAKLRAVFDRIGWE